jgi:hypothetical protein
LDFRLAILDLWRAVRAAQIRPQLTCFQSKIANSKSKKS